MEAQYIGMTWEAILPSLFTSLAGAGQFRMVEVESVGDYPMCDSPILTPETLFRALIGLDGDSKPALRVSVASTEDWSDGEFMDCTTKTTDPFINIKRLIGVDSNGDPCLRIKLDSL